MAIIFVIIRIEGFQQPNQNIFIKLNCAVGCGDAKLLTRQNFSKEVQSLVGELKQRHEMITDDAR